LIGGRVINKKTSNIDKLSSFIIHFIDCQEPKPKLDSESWPDISPELPLSNQIKTFDNLIINEGSSYTRNDTVAIPAVDASNVPAGEIMDWLGIHRSFSRVPVLAPQVERS